jgi:hypothetical protein
MLRRRLAKRKREDAGPDAAQWEEDAAADVDDTLASVQLLLSRSAQAFARIGVAPLVLWHQLCVAIALLLVTTFRPHERLPACIYGFAATPSSPTGPSSTKT